MKQQTKFKQTEIGMIPEDWEVKGLGNFTVKIGSGITPKGGSSVYIGKGVALIRSQNVYNTGFNKEGLAYIDNETAELMKNVELREGDVLLNITGDSVARCCIVPSKVLPARVNQHVLIIRAKKELNSYFLRYYLISEPIQKSLLSLADSGGTRQALTKTMIESFDIPIIDIKEQSAIAKILSDLDSKIELNREMNKTLEAIGQAIFKHWFVDFEFPNEKGKPYKSFGGEMIETELGEIPKGWKVGKLGDLITIAIGGDWGEENEFYGSIPVICLRGTDLQHLKEDGYSPDAPVRWIKNKSLEQRKITDCDLLIGGSGLGPIGRSLYFHSYISFLWNYPIIYSNFCKRLTAKNKFNAAYAEILIETIYKSGEMKKYTIGTSIPNLDTNGLLTELIIIPSVEILELFYKILEIKFIQHYKKENLILSQIRDSLLPKLMSGKIRIPIEVTK